MMAASSVAYTKSSVLSRPTVVNAGLNLPHPGWMLSRKTEAEREAVLMVQPIGSGKEVEVTQFTLRTSVSCPPWSVPYA